MELMQASIASYLSAPAHINAIKATQLKYTSDKAKYYGNLHCEYIQKLIYQNFKAQVSILQLLGEGDITK